jgi:hypothetical protein
MGKGRGPTPEESQRRRERAVALRRQGLSYKQILKIVEGSSSSLSVWLRDVPLTDLQRVGLRRRKQEAIERMARRLRENRLAREAAIRREAAAEVGTVSDRDLFIAGLVAYAAEGTKNKPWGGPVRVQFVNSDPRMITMFLRWLELIGVQRDSISVRLAIHETADVRGALDFWANIVGVPVQDFRRTALKRHNPKTSRKLAGPAYRGCLAVTVRKSIDLNRRINGWFQALVDDLEKPSGGGTLVGRARPAADILSRSGVV